MTVISMAGNQSFNSLLSATKTTIALPVTEQAQQTPTTQSVSVTLGRLEASDSTPVYTITRPVPLWEKASGDSISSKMAGNFSSAATAVRFQGLGAALLNRFSTDSSNFSQSVRQASASDGMNTAKNANNQFSLSIKTASGTLVNVMLGSDNDGLGVQIEVTNGNLNEAERAALAKMSDGFQKAIDGLTEQPPRLDLGGLTKFDTSVLSSVDLHARLAASEGQTLDFHADSQQRSVKSTGIAGTVDISVDMSKRALLGNATQQQQALNQYLKQFDSAKVRGNGNESLMTMFKDAFSALNSNYGEAVATQKNSAPAPIHFSLSGTDKNMLTGLADFTASVTQTPDNTTNPLRPDEADTFAYQVSQTSSVTGTSAMDRAISQKQQSHLVASYHKPLSSGLKLHLTTLKDSQNYEYTQIDDKAKSATEIQYRKGALASATLNQSASTSLHVSRYIKGSLESDATHPEQTAKSVDLLGMLQSAWEKDNTRMSFDTYLSQHTLPDFSTLVLLQTDPLKMSQTEESTSAA
ncbi:hypothetical protein ACMV8I_08605 [Ewingella sp. S1.OA.A_B6]